MGGGGFRGTHSGKPRKQKGKMPMNNQNQNEQFKAVVSKLKLTKDQARRLHDEDDTSEAIQTTLNEILENKEKVELELQRSNMPLYTLD